LLLGSNVKTKRFEFTPETAVCNVLVAQVGRKTVPTSKHVARRQPFSQAPVAELACDTDASAETRSPVHLLEV